MNGEVRDPLDLRCSDSDREQVAEVLRDAATHGRLTLNELEERLEATFSAKTYRDLQPITADLGVRPPGGHPKLGQPAAVHPVPAGQPGQMAQHAGAPAVTGRSERIVSILGGDKRAGRWEVPARLEVSCLLGEVVLDFTESIVRHPHIVVDAGIVLGSLTIIVPDGADVRLEPGANILGERKSKLRTPATLGGPVIQVRGFVLLGDITVRPPRRQLWGTSRQ